MFLVWSWEGETESVPAAEEPCEFPSRKACRTLIQHPPSTITQYPLALGDPEVLPEFGQTNKIGPKSGKTLRFGITGTTSIKKSSGCGEDTSQLNLLSLSEDKLWAS